MEEKNLTGYPSIDKPWLKYYSEEAINSAPPEGSVYDNLYSSIINCKDRTAIRFNKHEITYKQLFLKGLLFE